VAKGDKNVIVVWLRDDKLHKAQAYSARSWRRAANRWNEYAQLSNRRFGHRKNFVGVILEKEVLGLIREHDGIPKHLDRKILAARRRIRELLRVAPWGSWKN